MNFRVIYPKDLAGMQQNSRVVLVDLRESASYQRGHWEGAVSAPLRTEEELERRLDRSKGYIFYCDYGGSSMQIARQLGNKGYQVATVVGGWDAMQKFTQKTIPKNGKMW